MAHPRPHHHDHRVDPTNEMAPGFDRAWEHREAQKNRARS
jgi:hypothetical protein